jgi:hypothetical protein
MKKLRYMIVLCGTLAFSVGAVYAGACQVQCEHGANAKNCGDNMQCICCCSATGYPLCGACAATGQEKAPDGCAPNA